jgi:hypothetical protein
MGKIWVLDTETKGTGANVVPLEKVLERPGPSPQPLFVPRKPDARAPEPPEPATPRKFKVVDLMTRRALAEGASTRATVELLRGIRSVVDVNLYVWQEDSEAWRLLTLHEQGMLWELAGATD